MKFQINEYSTKSGEIILYNGTPDFDKLEELSKGNGDIWHSSFEQGYKNAFNEIVYQTNVTWWYVNDFDSLDSCVSWRVNPYNFAIRKNVWDLFIGFDQDYQSNEMKALALGFDIIRNGGIPYYVKGLFVESNNQFKGIDTQDLYSFYIKKFKPGHINYFFMRKGIFKPMHWISFFIAKQKFQKQINIPQIEQKELIEIKGAPTVSFIIPTMLRQDMTLQLLDDLKAQTFLPSEVVVVDATPNDKRDESLYNQHNYPFKLVIKWQITKGSCRARNEAINLCTGDYIVFGDDDIRVQPNYIENQIRFLQTYKASACNGLDIQADNFKQNLDDLQNKINKLSKDRFKVGVASSFNNANSCVERKFVNQLQGNDINFDGGYGEDGDFGLSLLNIGITVLYNPYSRNLHLKPPAGGYRFWGTQSKIMGKNRKKQPWELNHPVGWIRPVPSPTIMYGIIKQFDALAQKEYKYKYFLHYLARGSIFKLPFRILYLPMKWVQFNKAMFYAKNLLNLGVRHQ